MACICYYSRYAIMAVLSMYCYYSSTVCLFSPIPIVPYSSLYLTPLYSRFYSIFYMLMERRSLSPIVPSHMPFHIVSFPILYFSQNEIPLIHPTPTAPFLPLHLHPPPPHYHYHYHPPPSNSASRTVGKEALTPLTL